MKSRGRITVGLMFLTLVVAVGGLAPADAGTCGTTSTCTFELTVSNVPQLSPIDVRVTWDNTGSVTVFDVQWISGGPGTPKFINEFGYNSSVAVSSISGGGLFSAWTATTNAVIDGFGTFATDEQRPDGSFGISAPIVFTLASKITSIALNDKSTEFVAHVAGYPSGCSGFVGEAGSTPGTTSDPSCGVVPEPGTLALLGSGLVSVGALLRRRLFNRGQVV